MRRPLAGLAAGAAAVAGMLLAAACGGSGSGAPSLSTPLLRVLGRVAATATTRTYVSFDDTSGLTALVGKNTFTGYGSLLFLGAPELGQSALVLDNGVALPDADYTVSAGLPPRTVSLVAGGQSSDKIDTALTKLGWTSRNGVLVAPPLGALAGNTAPLLAEAMAQARTDGADLAYGQQSASLADVGHPSGATLAWDPIIGAVAGCLGDVVAATIVTTFPPNPGGITPSGVAVGIRRPGTKTDTPHAAVCAAFPDDATANRYAGKVRDQLAHGVSARTASPYSSMLTHPAVTVVGGGEHLVSLQADTPDRPGLVLSLALHHDLPELNCGNPLRLACTSAGLIFGNYSPPG